MTTAYDVLHPDIVSVLDGLDASTREVKEGARVLPAAAYGSPVFHDFEKRAVWQRSWLCVGRVQQVPTPGTFLAVTILDEPLLIVRGDDMGIRAMSALCRHRGHALRENCSGETRRFVCPYHHWSYTLTGDLVGAPRMEDAVEIKRLREESQLPLIRTEIWHGFIFINFDSEAKPLAPSLVKLEPYLAGYDLDTMVTIPPTFGPDVPWNWKLLLENYIEPYHTEYVHPGIHDFAPSTGVEFDGWNGDEDNVIVRYVPFLEPDGGLTERGWAAPASFPPIETLSPKQRHRVGFGMLPPSMNIIFTPDMLCYGLIYPTGPKSLTVGGGLFTRGGWCMPKSTVDLPDFEDRVARMMEGSRQLGEQDTSVNIAMQQAKSSAFAPRGRLAPLEETLAQFNRWLAARYRAEADRMIDMAAQRVAAE
ncbi:MAG: aromatic ring-hydroxylating dioxygenase subunit alpha [Bauldia sp.]|nr:aromatic ring-hydroxylating dioxygenase subunit alpha [Bauldia sp.]